MSLPTVTNISVYKNTYYMGDCICGEISFSSGYSENLIQIDFAAYIDKDIGGDMIAFEEIGELTYSVENGVLPSKFSIPISIPQNISSPANIEIFIGKTGENNGYEGEPFLVQAVLSPATPPLLDIQSHGVGFLTSANTSGQYSLNIKEDAKVIEFYPIGSLYFSINNTNPSNYFGGTWELFGPGRTIKGVSYAQTVGEVEPEITGGEKTHQLTINEMPAHTHEYRMDSKLKSGSNYNRIYSYGLGGSGASAGYLTSSAGGDQPHNNLQPYITCYIWKRTG